MANYPENYGTTTDVTDDGPYAAGTGIEILAEPIENYVFDGWTADAGIFDDEGSANTIFNMPGQDVTVTANYKRKRQSAS